LCADLEYPKFALSQVMLLKNIRKKDQELEYMREKV
jgi:hypothetical protein